MREIYPTASFYGHACILKQYAALSDFWPLPFGVQHGYFFLPGSYDAQDLNQNISADVMWVWSKQDAIDLKQFLPSACIKPLGAPFLYLLASTKIKAIANQTKCGTIVFPPHSSETIKIDGKHFELCKYLNTLGEKYKPIEVCLYYKDKQHGAHHIYLNNGFNVFTIADDRYDKLYLTKFINRTINKKYAIVSAFTTAALYCSYLGLYCSHIDIKQEIISNTNQHYSNADSNFFQDYSKEKHKDIANRFFGVSIEEQMKFASAKLGEEHLLTKKEARKLIASEMNRIKYVRQIVAAQRF